MCCTLLSVPEIEKPANTPCRHCNEKGCAIYATRPTLCRGYACGWLISDPDAARANGVDLRKEDDATWYRMSSLLRPDLCHVVLTFAESKRRPGYSDDSRLIVVVDPKFPKAWKVGAMAKFLDRWLRQQEWYMVQIGDGEHFAVIGVVDDEGTLIKKIAPVRDGRIVKEELRDP